MNRSRANLNEVPEFLRQELGWNLGEIWEPMPGGRTNQIWKVVHPTKEPVVCKLYAEHKSNALFPNDPHAEALVLDVLSGTGFAPRILKNVQRAEGRAVFYEFVPGKMGPASPAKAATILSALHSHPTIPGLRTIPTGSAAIRMHALEMLNDLSNKRELLALAPNADVPDSTKQAFLHGDPVPANMIQHGSKITMIDWQCPANGDPCEDIAVFLSPAMQHLYGRAPPSEADLTAFWMAYDNADVHARYLRLAPMFHWRMAIYCCWMAEREFEDYVAGYDLEVRALKEAHQVSQSDRDHKSQASP